MNSDVKNQPLPSESRIPLVAVLLFGGFIAILNQTLLNTAIPKIMSDLDISTSSAQWLTTAFMLTNGIMIPITAFLIGTFSTRKLFITAMSLFAIGTLVAAFSPNFQFLLTGRIIQAAGAGIMMPLMQTVLLTVFPVEKRGQAMGMVGLVIAFAPAIGPTLSGWLVEHHSWRLLFYIIFPIAVIDIIFAIFMLKNVTKLTKPKIDIISIILSTFGFGGLLYGLSSAGSNGWGSKEVYISLIVGGVALIVFIWRQLILKTPMLEFRVFKNKVFPLTTAINMIVMMAMLGAELLLPIYMQTMRGFTSLESGLLLLPGALAMGVMSPIAGRLFDKIGARLLALIGLADLAAMTWMLSDITASTSFTFIATVYAVRMLGIAMVMMPISTAGLNSLPQHLIPHGAAMNNTMRQVAGAIGTALLVTVMSNSTTNYLSNNNPPKGLSMAAAKAKFTSDAMIHGINEAFMVATLIAIVGLVLSFFIKPYKRTKKAA